MTADALKISAVPRWLLLIDLNQTDRLLVILAAGSVFILMSASLYLRKVGQIMEEHRHTQTQAGIASACSWKIRWPGGSSGLDRPQMPGAMPSPRHQ